MTAIIIAIVLYILNLALAYVIGYLKASINVSKKVRSKFADVFIERDLDKLTTEEHLQLQARLKAITDIYNVLLDRTDMPWLVRQMDKVYDYFHKKPVAAEEAKGEENGT